MNKRPTVVKPASEGAKRILMKDWVRNNSNPERYEILSVEQVIPNGAMLMEFENDRSELESPRGAWLTPRKGRDEEHGEREPVDLPAARQL